MTEHIRPSEILRMALAGNMQLVVTPNGGGYLIQLKGGSENITLDLFGLSEKVAVNMPDKMQAENYANIVAEHLASNGWSVKPPPKVETHVRLGPSESLIPTELRKDKLL